MVALIYNNRKATKDLHPEQSLPTAPLQEAPHLGQNSALTSEAALLQSACELMEREKLYLDKNLRISDMATILKTNTSYLSDCINKEQGRSFSQFVNNYRVNHAIELMRQHPGEKLSNVALASGFANDTSFFRSFKGITGMTPREWLKR